MKCPKCGFENLKIASFCIKCGARIDGKIPCPKCGEYISNDSIKCPHCGKAIPHKKESDIAKNQEISPRREKIARIFNRVSSYITLFSFVALILWTILVDYLFYWRFFQIGFSSYFSYPTSIMGFAFHLINDAIVYTFSIIGLVKGRRAFKNPSLIIETYKYLVIVLFSWITTTALSYAVSQYIEGSSPYSISTFIFTLIITHLIICLGFDCFLHFKRGQISVFIARIILAIGMVLPLIIINSFALQNYYGNEGFILHFVRMFTSLLDGNYSTGFVSAFIFASASFVLAIFIISLTFSFVIYFASAYFKGMARFKKFRIAFYLQVISISIFSVAYLISSGVELFLYNAVMSTSLVLSPTPVIIFICSVLLVGVAIATFNIYNRYDRRVRLEEKTTVVE